MKARYIYIILLIPCLYGSMLEIYGTGERHHQMGAQGIGLGNTYFFSDYSNGLNPYSMATFSKSDLTRINFSPQFSSNIGGMNDKDITISSFSFSFPIGNLKTISFGLTPYTRSEIKVLESDGYTISQNSSNFIDHALNSYSEYEFYGGISNFSTGISMGLGKKIILLLNLILYLAIKYKWIKLSSPHLMLLMIPLIIILLNKILLQKSY